MARPGAIRHLQMCAVAHGALASKQGQQLLFHAAGLGQGALAPQLAGPQNHRVDVALQSPAEAQMLALQGISEIIKRFGALNGYVQVDARYERPTQ